MERHQTWEVKIFMFLWKMFVCLSQQPKHYGFSKFSLDIKTVSWKHACSIWEPPIAAIIATVASAMTLI